MSVIPREARMVGTVRTFRRSVQEMVESEDFSFMLQMRPGAYFRLGQGGAESGCVLHNSHFDFNDAVIPLGSAMFSALAERGMPLAD
ncbi:amidohydrolase/peptidase [Bordetella pertussis]|nr:amidohydrolase/peptidase [Bordetella pertussis]